MGYDTRPRTTFDTTFSVSHTRSIPHLTRIQSLATCGYVDNYHPNARATTIISTVNTTNAATVTTSARVVSISPVLCDVLVTALYRFYERLEISDAALIAALALAEYLTTVTIRNSHHILVFGLVIDDKPLARPPKGSGYRTIVQLLCVPFPAHTLSSPECIFEPHAHHDYRYEF